MATRWERIARETVGEDYAAAYDRRFRALAEHGDDVHGEAAFVERLRPSSPRDRVGDRDRDGDGDRPTRVLDAGCGTGRVAVRLAERGYDVVGVDVDASMLARAREAAPWLGWHEADLATLDLGDGAGEPLFDVVLVAGNTLPLLEPGTLAAACARLAAHLGPDGCLVAGFGIDEAHLPGDCPVTPLADVEAALAATGLTSVSRYGGWDGAAFEPGAGYVVLVVGRADRVAP